jgi:AraC-like DNA-binding protein
MLPLPQDNRLRQIYQSLEQHPEQQTTLNHWSEKFGVTEKTLSRLFLRDTGLTFRAWRQRLRLLGADPAGTRRTGHRRGSGLRL